MMTCAICNKKQARAVKRPYSARYNRIPVKLQNVEMYECGQCGERFLTPEQARRLTVRVKATAREKLGLLPPDRIVEVRKHYGLTQTDLERLLGLGPKVITRWEKGKVLQTRPVDDLLRLMRVLPDVYEKLKEIRRQGSFSRTR